MIIGNEEYGLAAGGSSWSTNGTIRPHISIPFVLISRNSGGGEESSTTTVTSLTTSPSRTAGTFYSSSSGGSTSAPAGDVPATNRGEKPGCYAAVHDPDKR